MSAEQQNEFIVRVPNDTKKQFHVMRFNSALNVDVTKLKNCKLERELMFKENKEQQQQQQLQQQPEEEPPEFGAGSEFGRKEREEAKKRKYERRKIKQNNSPWILKVGGKHGKKYRGIREGGVTENASYYVFFQASDGMFEAFPVNEWYNFTPFQRYKALSAEEAEEKFIKRDQILNFFQLRNMAKTKSENDKDETGKKSERKMKKEFKVSDMDDWDMSDNDNLSGDELDDSDDDSNTKKSKANKGKKDKKKIKKEESDVDEPLEDSDEGDYDDKEVDYMSDESSSSESEEEKVDLKGVADESALRDLVVSEDDEEEEQDADKKENQEQNGDVNNKSTEADENKAIKSDKKNDSGSESDFDSENSDIDESAKSALLIQPTKLSDESKSSDTSSSAKRKLEDLNHQSSSSSNKEDNSSNNKSNGLKFKHKLENPMSSEQSMAKKMKIQHDNGINEEAVRRYLIRKPMTAADLVQKFKNKTACKKELLDQLGEILRKINPEKQNIKGKMYLSLKPT